MTRNRNALFIVLASVLTVVNSFYLLAQSGTSSALAGTVADKSGAVVVNAAIKATDLNTGAVRSVQSNPDGRFLFSQVNPGTYRIEVHAQGFAPAQSEPTIVSVGQTASVNFSLSPAAAEQTVEVEAQVGLMSLENPNTSTTLEAEDHQEPAQPRPGPDLCRSVCPWSVDEYSRLVQRRQGCGWLRKR